MAGSPAPSPPEAHRALARLAVTGALLLAVWWPAWPGGSDGFPLSNYPMFGYARPSVSRVRTVLGVRPDGRRVPLTPWHIGGTGQAKQALSTAQNAVRDGHAAALCAEVVARVTASPPPAPLVALEVVTDSWDVLGSIRPGSTPRSRRVHARCEVP